jgi:hypothetical protein
MDQMCEVLEDDLKLAKAVLLCTVSDTGRGTRARKSGEGGTVGRSSQVAQCTGVV